jgi:hypothetical protein
MEESKGTDHLECILALSDYESMDTLHTPSFKVCKGQRNANDADTVACRRQETVRSAARDERVWLRYAPPPPDIPSTNWRTRQTLMPTGWATGLWSYPQRTILH